MNALGGFILCQVAILMSSYNGSKYISKQIDSIREQTYDDWDLYIRDDGSNDDTCNIIREYLLKDRRIHFIEECGFKNVGPKVSFFSLLKQIEADYYFFCDQDDYWLKNKLEEELKFLKIQNSPCLVYCGLKCVDEKLEKIPRPFERLVGSLNGINSSGRFIANDIPGCVMGFNNKLREIFLYTYDYSDIMMHDWWLCLLATVFGKIIFIPKKLVLYRQHSNNTIGAGSKKSLISKIFNKEIQKKQISFVKGSVLQGNTFLMQYFKFISKFEKIFLTDFFKSYSGNRLEKIRFLIKYKPGKAYSFRTLVYYLLFINTSF
jgi:rhamnosyltransferase